MNLSTTVFGVDFQNPVLLAAGTCGFGMELQDVVDSLTQTVANSVATRSPACRVTARTSGAGSRSSAQLALGGIVCCARLSCASTMSAMTP